jgi:hypothetical protein
VPRREHALGASGARSPSHPLPPPPPGLCRHLAADQGLTEAVAILSTSGADLNVPREEDSRTPL